MPVNDPPSTPTTSTASTTVVVPSSPPPVPARSFEDFSDVKFVFFAIVGIVVGAKYLVDFVKSIMEAIDKKRSGDKEKNAPLESRFKAIEEAARTFRSSEYLDKEFSRLEGKIDHDRRERRSCDDSLLNEITKVKSSVVDEQIARNRLESKIEGMASNAQRIETAVEMLRERIDEGFTQITAALAKK